MPPLAAFNHFFGGSHMHCLPHTYNCYDPFYLHAGTDDATVHHDKLLLSGNRAAGEAARAAERALFTSLKHDSGDKAELLWARAAATHGSVSSAR